MAPRHGPFFSRAAAVRAGCRRPRRTAFADQVPAPPEADHVPMPGPLLPGQLAAHLDSLPPWAPPLPDEDPQREKHSKRVRALADPRVKGGQMTAEDWHHAPLQIPRLVLSPRRRHAGRLPAC